MPQNLPGFGFNHDNLGAERRRSSGPAFFSGLVNTASARGFAAGHVSLSRRTTASTTSWANSGLRASDFGGQGAWGAPYFNVQGYSPMGDSWLATPMHAWDTILEGRDTLSWQRGAHSLKFGGSYRWYHLADVGSRAEPRLLLIHVRVHHADGDE